MANKPIALDFSRRLTLADKFRLDLAVEKATGDVEFLLTAADPTRNGTWRIYRAAGRD